MTAETAIAPTRTRIRLLSLVGIPVLLLLSLFAWALASPIGAGPDDDFHLSSIWCGGATSHALCAPGPTDEERLVSPDLFTNSTCYALQSTESAECQGDGFGDDLTSGLSPTDRGNFAGLYPPVYYSVMSVFAGSDLDSAALTMRAVNGLLFVAMVTGLFLLLPVTRRPTMLLATAVTFIPLGIFLIPSNNPSGWAVLSASTLWIALLGYFETTGVRRIALGAVALLATILGAGARADSAIYAGIAIVTAVMLTARRGREYVLLCALPLALAIVSVVGLLSAGQASAASAGLSGDRAGYGLYVFAVENVLQLPALLAGSFGTWGLGWLDTPMPAIVPFATISVFVAAVLLGLRSRSRRKSIATLFLVALLVAIPLFILYRSDAMVGSQVQPRYLLPIIIMLAGVLLLDAPATGIRPDRRRALLMALALSVANAAALHANIRRYVTGTDITGGNLDTDAEWWWDLPISPMAVFVLGSLAFAATTFWLALHWIAYQRGATTKADLQPLTAGS